MRHLLLIPACLAGGLMLSACAEKADETVERAFQDVNVVDENDLNDVMLTVADPNEAVSYFSRVVKNDPSRADAQRNYSLPVIPMDQTERAQLLHTMALSAVKQGDVQTGKGLLQEAINTHPQHFEEAVRSLRALEAG